MHRQQQARRVAGGVHRQRRHQLGEAVEHEARAVVERRQRRQVLVLALAAGADEQRAVELVRPAARRVERERAGSAW